MSNKKASLAFIKLAIEQDLALKELFGDLIKMNQKLEESVQKSSNMKKKGTSIQFF